LGIPQSITVFETNKHNSLIFSYKSQCDEPGYVVAVSTPKYYDATKHARVSAELEDVIR